MRADSALPQSEARSATERAIGFALAHPGWMVALAVIAVYANTLGNQPVLDDGWVIFENPLIKSFANIGRIFREPYNAAGSATTAGVYRPVTTLTYALNYAVGGSNVVGYHLVNLALHVCCCLAVLALARLFVGMAAGPLLGALLFAVHPVHVEAVTSMVGRAELLAALGALGCLYLACTRHKSRWRLPAALVVLALAVLCKENAAVTPLLFLLVAIALPAAAGLPAQPGLFSAPGRRALGRACALAVGLACAAAVYFLLRPQRGLAVDAASQWFAGEPRTVVFNTMTRALAQYLELLVFPHPLGVDFYYADKIGLIRSFGLESLASTVAWILVLGFGLASLRRAPIRALGILWIFVALLPVLNIIPIGTLMSERLLYLPSAGFCIAVGAGAALLPGFLRERLGTANRGWTLAAALVTVVLFACGVKCWTRNADWRDPLTLWEAELLKEPENAVVNNNLAVEYTSRGNLTRARERLEVALRTAPLYWRAHVNMGIIAHQLHDDGTAIRFLQQARRIDPSAPSPPFFLGVVLADQGDLAAAIRSLADAEDAAPLDARTRLYRGWYLYRLGRIPEARSELLRARELDPSDPRAAAYLAEIADRGSGRAASAGPK